MANGRAGRQHLPVTTSAGRQLSKRALLPSPTFYHEPVILSTSRNPSQSRALDPHVASKDRPGSSRGLSRHPERLSAVRRTRAQDPPRQSQLAVRVAPFSASLTLILGTPRPKVESFPVFRMSHQAAKGGGWPRPPIRGEVLCSQRSNTYLGPAVPGFGSPHTHIVTTGEIPQ